MSNRKKQSPKNKPTSQRKKQEVEKNKIIVSNRVKTILLGMVALLSLVLVLIPGEMWWAGVRSFFFGIFGISTILIPIALFYLTFIKVYEKRVGFFNIKMALCGGILLMSESLMYLLFSAEYNSENYFVALGKLYSDIATSNCYYPITSGLLGGLLGYPLRALCGAGPAILFSLILLAGLLLIIFKVSLKDVGAGIKRISKRKRPSQQPVEKEDNDLEIGHYDAHNGYKSQEDVNIDIPLESKRKKKKSKENAENIDIPFEEKNPSEKFMEDIKKAEQQEKDELLQLDDVVKNAVKEASKKKEEKSEITPDFVEEKTTYKYPPIGLLKLVENKVVGGDAEMKENGEKLIETLASFGVKVNITFIARGPSVTRYEIKPAPGVKISKITNLADDIALALAAKGVRIEAPIPGKAAVGIEVPNKNVSMVSMRELIDSAEFKNHKSKLACVLGKDISGQIIITDLASMPHLLIAGTTGSGKSVCVNALLMSILYKATPEEVKLLLIDPKMVEFSKYKGIPHLLVPVVSDAKKSAGALNWAVSEMLQRYKIFSEYDCKDIDSYNNLIQSNIEYMKENPPVIDEDSESEELVQPVLEVNGLPVAKEKMPRIVIAIDELADLMMAAPKEVEDSIARLAQMARAAGMHLVIATQRPSVNVITGLIKANIPSRISLKVSSNIDSRTILDAGGAEKLIGKGDMLYSPVGALNPVRIQCCFATDAEIEGVTGYIKKSAKAEYNAEIEETIKRIAAEDLKVESEQKEEGASSLDAKMEEAIKVVIDAGQASTSMLQRKLQVGYARAGRMIDDMENLGIVGPYQGSKPRDVLMTYNQWLERKNIIGNND